MDKVIFSRNLNYQLRNIKEHLSYHKTYYIVLGFIAVTAILTGSITAFKVAGDVSTSTVTDIALIELITGDRSVGSFIFNRILVYFLSLGVAFISTINVFMFGIDVFAIISKGYFIGVNCSCLIIIYGITGTFNVVFIILPCALLYLFFQICFSAILMKRCVAARRYGKAASKQSITEMYLKFILVFLVLGVLICLLEGVLLSIFVKRFVLIL